MSDTTAISDWYRYIGATKQDVSDLFENLGGVTSSKTMKDHEYVNIHNRGVSFCFQHGRLESIIFYNHNVDKFHKFEGHLPHDLSLDDTNVQVVTKLGEPSDKGGGVLPVWIAYEVLGVQIDFISRSWEDQNNPISHITIFSPLAPDFGMCYVCGKQASKKCGSCRQVTYCSSTCQRKDWSKHKLQCGRSALRNGSGDPPVTITEVTGEDSNHVQTATATMTGVITSTTSTVSQSVPPVPTEDIDID
eukprot:GILJ01012460.1.p1 GENE.GILJ01012460.1~~GILJ01012460.1.p1  ORF type:complete len:247 (-),score=15.86 GILJ01012460.1:155-895(-)